MESKNKKNEAETSPLYNLPQTNTKFNEIYIYTFEPYYYILSSVELDIFNAAIAIPFSG